MSDHRRFHTTSIYFFLLWHKIPIFTTIDSHNLLFKKCNLSNKIKNQMKIFQKFLFRFDKLNFYFEPIYIYIFSFVTKSMNHQPRIIVPIAQNQSYRFLERNDNSLCIVIFECDSILIIEKQANVVASMRHSVFKERLLNDKWEEKSVKIGRGTKKIRETR